MVTDLCAFPAVFARTDPASETDAAPVLDNCEADAEI
jgi:hypothetical protein